MNRAAFRQFMEQVNSMTVKQRADLLSRLQETAPSQPNKVIEGLEQRVQQAPLPALRRLQPLKTKGRPPIT